MRFVFIFLKNHLENGLESPLIFVYFFKRENKIRYKNSSVTLFLEKTFLQETESKFGGHVTYWEGTVVSRNTPLSS